MAGLLYGGRDAVVTKTDPVPALPELPEQGEETDETHGHTSKYTAVPSYPQGIHSKTFVGAWNDQ